MVVEKTGREVVDEVVSWKESVWALEARLAPLRDEMVAGMLGSRAYRELVLVEDLRAQIVTSVSSITTGVKREVDGSAIPELYSVKRARL
ncbi:hypothetical protein CDEST_08040 [Colletotrichum destructivum]|uniref:Uncharacterized protein n=1 Tax=Colletotrichum destructivum TaxID=34406 RepID=A0AAX4IIU7_9PEZI|nr:hypothetical protein CDEST_08040 [Colletotrichum destructivum]